MTVRPGKPDAKLLAAEQKLAKLAAGFPETVEENPWDHRAFKVRGKTFVFLAMSEGRLSLSVKLPHTGVVALELPFCEPTGYGLGKSGWVSASFGPGDEVPVGMIAEWFEESFAAIAPKRVAAARAVAAPAKKKSAKR